MNLNLMPDLRAAVRGLLRAPRVSIAAVLCIALGATAVTAIASLVFAALLQPLPFPEADRLVRVWLSEKGAGVRDELTYADLADLRGAVPALDRIEATARARLAWTAAAGGRRVEGEAVTAGYFELVGAETVAGRLFTPEEYATGARVLVLGFDSWITHFGGAVDVVGRSIATADEVFEIVGVMGPGFTGTIEADSGELEFWVPILSYLREVGRTRRDGGGVWSIGRLAASGTIGAAAAQAAGLGDRIAEQYPLEREGRTYTVEALSENWRAELRAGSWLLLGAAALLLLVAATNVAGLMLARALGRRREIAVRAALGAGSWRTVRLLSLEALLLAATGGAVGLVLGPLALDGFRALIPVSVPVYVSLDPDTGTVAVVLGVLALAAAIAGAGPAVFALRVDPIAALRDGGRGATVGPAVRRLGATLVVGQVAVTAVLLAGAALLLRSYRSLDGAEMGFRTERLLRIATFASELDASDSALVPLQRRMRDAIRGRPGVAAVARVWPTVPIVTPAELAVRFAGMPETQRGGGLRVGWYAVDEAFFSTLGIPIVAGRDLRATDAVLGAPVAVVSASLAGKLGGESSAVGRMVDADGVAYRIVGVAGDARFTTPRAPAAEYDKFYTLLEASPSRLTTFLVRTTPADAGSLVPEIRRALARVAPFTALDWTDPVQAAFRERWVDERFVLSLLATFSISALVLAGTGLFAVLAFLVTRSRTEFGVRQALGATRRDIVGGVVRRAVALVGAGLAVGLVVALVASAALARFLYGVSRFDLLAYVGAAVLLLVVGIAASALPARRAVGTEPGVALRSE